MDMRDTPQPNTPTDQEILRDLERDFQEKSNVLTAARETLTKAQEAVINAQESAFKSYRQLSTTRERYLIGLLQQREEANRRVRELAQTRPRSSSTQQATIQETPEESREDNIQ